MSDDRVQAALAAHIEHAEVGGPAPDTSHLSSDELAELTELIALLGVSEGVAFGRGVAGGDEEGAAPATPATDRGKQLASILRDALPPNARVAADEATTTVRGLDITDRLVVGTFGGRVRVLLLEEGSELGSNESWLRDLGRIFRSHPETVAVALVTVDQECLIVQPQDCAPTIEVPRGSVVGRRYRRPVAPVTESLPAFVRELIPQWEGIVDFGSGDARPIDIAPIARETAAQAIADQVSAGSRARKTNPKREVLTALSDTESDAVTKLIQGVHDGNTSPDDVEGILKGLGGS